MQYRKTEFWVVTAIIIFLIFSFVQEAAAVLNEYDYNDIPHYYGYRFFENGLRFDMLQHRTYPLISYCFIIYFSFLLINFYIYPKLYSKKDITLTLVLALLLYTAAVFLFSVTDTWYKGYMQVGFWYFFLKNLVLVVVLFGGIALYIYLKDTVLRTYTIHTAGSKTFASAIKQEVRVVGGIWFGILLLFVISFDDSEARTLGAFWFAMVPYAYLLYALNRYWLLPEYEKDKKQFWSYFTKLLSYSLLLFLPFVLVFSALIYEFEPGMFVANWVGQLLVMGTLSWLVYRRNRHDVNQLITLKKELGQTTADLQFLRSQINPHFLFNSLNTLYGTALQENSERTAQGIQMLGDMMRFMLHENHQHKILLTRELEYMRNYIELQSLRVSTTPDIVIQTRIEDVLDEKFIAPMLLIPFVENAFKHGISLKQKSWIKVTLRYDQGKLYFDVYNSTHSRLEQDPEKDKSGVGLENVKQRLALLYPDQHELVIRETAEEFFVHLTIQL